MPCVRGTSIVYGGGGSFFLSLSLVRSGLRVWPYRHRCIIHKDIHARVLGFYSSGVFLSERAGM